MRRFVHRLGSHAFASLLGASALWGCGSGSSVTTTGGCAGIAFPAVQVFVYDSSTGEPTARGATATLQDGAYTENLLVKAIDDHGLPLSLAGAYERPGTYTLRVTKPGYTDFQQTGIQVTRGVCGVTTRTIRADLVPTS